MNPLQAHHGISPAGGDDARMKTKALTSSSFADLGLPEVLLRGVEAAGFDQCTPIQAEALPTLLAGSDVAGQAQTGTGKTAAFLLALFNRLLTVPAAPDRRPTQPRALVLAPTRELAIQIHKDAEVLGQFAGLRLGLVYGGTGYDEQRTMLEQGVDVLIGTPGRLIDYFKQHLYDLKAIQVCVLDEADRMFDLGFIKDVRFMLRKMPDPDQRLNMLFSATLSHRVGEFGLRAHERAANRQGGRRSYRGRPGPGSRVLHGQRGKDPLADRVCCTAWIRPAPWCS